MEYDIKHYSATVMFRGTPFKLTNLWCRVLYNVRTEEYLLKVLIFVYKIYCLQYRAYTSPTLIFWDLIPDACSR